MNSYELKIDTSFGIVSVQSDDFSFMKRVQEAIDIVIWNADQDAKEKVTQLVNDLFTSEVEKMKQPAKKRGRPVGSTNKARKAK